MNEQQVKYLYRIGMSSTTSKKSQISSEKPKNVEVHPPTKIAKDFIHSGLGYSPTRRGMLVVDNNAVGIEPIPCNPYSEFNSKNSVF